MLRIIRYSKSFFLGLGSCTVKENKSGLNARCIFPFVFDGVSFTGCTNYDDRTSNPWCSTKTDEQGRHVGEQGHWGECPSSCPTDLKLDSNPGITHKIDFNSPCLL